MASQQMQWWMEIRTRVLMQINKRTCNPWWRVEPLEGRGKYHMLQTLTWTVNETCFSLFRFCRCSNWSQPTFSGQWKRPGKWDNWQERLSHIQGQRYWWALQCPSLHQRAQQQGDVKNIMSVCQRAETNRPVIVCLFSVRLHYYTVYTSNLKSFSHTHRPRAYVNLLNVCLHLNVK